MKKLSVCFLGVVCAISILTGCGSTAEITPDELQNIQGQVTETAAETKMDYHVYRYYQGLCGGNPDSNYCLWDYTFTVGPELEDEKEALKKRYSINMFYRQNGLSRDGSVEIITTSDDVNYSSLCVQLKDNDLDFVEKMTDYMKREGDKNLLYQLVDDYYRKQVNNDKNTVEEMDREYYLDTMELVEEIDENGNVAVRHNVENMLCY